MMSIIINVIKYTGAKNLRNVLTANVYFKIPGTLNSEGTLVLLCSSTVETVHDTVLAKVQSTTQVRGSNALLSS